MLSIRRVRVATAAVRPALVYSVTADRLGGVVGLGRALSPFGRMSCPEPARPEDVCWPQRRGVLGQQASPAVGLREHRLCLQDRQGRVSGTC
jgi:hypothetical protein